MMDAPNEDDGVFSPMESVINGHRNMSTLSRRGTTTALPWDMKEGEFKLAATSSPSMILQDEELQARNRRHLDPFMNSRAAAVNDNIGICSDSDDRGNETLKAKKDSSSADAIVGTFATTKTASADVAMICSKSIDSIPIIALTGRTVRRSPSEDRNLKEAIQSRIAIAALIPGRTNLQCAARRQRIAPKPMKLMPGRTGRWSPSEDSNLMDATLNRIGRKDWTAIAALVPGRTNLQCAARWNRSLKKSIG
jgi:hypothetical protein